MPELLLLLFEGLEELDVFFLFEPVFVVEAGLSFFDTEVFDLLEESVLAVSSFFSSWLDDLSTSIDLFFPGFLVVTFFFVFSTALSDYTLLVSAVFVQCVNIIPSKTTIRTTTPNLIICLLEFIFTLSLFKAICLKLT